MHGRTFISNLFLILIYVFIVNLLSPRFAIAEEPLSETKQQNELELKTELKTELKPELQTGSTQEVTSKTNLISEDKQQSEVESNATTKKVTNTIKEQQPGHQVYIHAGQAKVKKSLLAFPVFQHLGSQIDKKIKNAGNILYNTVSNDLNVSAYFTFISPQAFLEDTDELSLTPLPTNPKGFDFANWKKIDSDFLIKGGYRFINGSLELEAYLYHVPLVKTVFNKTYKGTINNARSLAHSFSNDVIEKLTAKKSIFKTKIVVAKSQLGEKIKEIYIMDWDGQNVQKISRHRSITLSPSWSPDGKKIVYSAYLFRKKTKIPNVDLVLFDLEKQSSKVISSRTGYTSGASFYPDGKHIIATLAERKSPDLVKMTLDGDIVNEITNGPLETMNVEGVISPDGSKIAFSSTRSGSPMIYIADINGKTLKRVTFAGRYNASPSWSPDSNKIAFAGFEKNHFDIFIMDSNGLNLERLTSAYNKKGKLANNEDPQISPDGRHVLFTSDRTGSNQIYIINIDGTNERRLTMDRNNYYKPKMSCSIE